MDENYFLNMIKTVLNKADIKNKGFIVVDEGCELKRIIFLMGEEKYSIRLWEVLMSGKVEYTLYRTVKEHGEKIIDKGVYYLPI